jgi:hypothetical protein
VDFLIDCGILSCYFWTNRKWQFFCCLTVKPLVCDRRVIVKSTKKDIKEKTTLGDAEITSARNETRRTFLRRTGMAGLAVIGAGVAAPRPAVAADAVGAGSDSDVNDPYGGGSDSDANDPYGAGTDYDVAPSSSSSDAVGYGSDSDANDPYGAGTDYDPSDAVGYGTDAD